MASMPNVTPRIHPLVTGNLHHFPKSVAGKVPVLPPAQFVASLEK
jgi:hypothetical protein